MDLVIPVVADSEALELVQQGQRLLDEPAEDAQPAAVRRVPPAISVAIARPDSRIRCGSESYARSPFTFFGFRSGAPTLPPIGGIESISGSNCVTSWRFAPVSFAASGTPPASTTRWCFDPFFLRSTGLGPVFSPRASHGRSRSRRSPARGQ